MIVILLYINDYIIYFTLKECKLQMYAIQNYTVGSEYNELAVPGVLVRYRVSSLYNIHVLYRTVQYIKLANKKQARDYSFTVHYLLELIKFKQHYY